MILVSTEPARRGAGEWHLEVGAAGFRFRPGADYLQNGRPD